MDKKIKNEKQYDDVGEFLKFECKNCSKFEYLSPMRFICHDDGEFKEKTDTCPYWSERH